MSTTVLPLRPHHRLGRAALLVLGMSCLLTGLWGGLLRVPLPMPLPVEHANWITFHGPLMACGFLGTLISLERAVGLRAWWAYSAPLLVGTSAVAVASGVLGTGPRWVLVVGSLIYAVASGRILTIQKTLANRVMALGAAAWVGGNLLWATGHEVPQVVNWWQTFLLLTIVGERIELTRFQRPSPWSYPWLLGALALLGTGLVLEWRWPRAGGLSVGLAMAALAFWLLRFDLAWRTIRHPGLTRFMAVCLLSGYGWLLGAGVTIALTWPLTSGVLYEAALHAFFVGFVFSMIFGHAPVIFPAVLEVPVRFLRTSYVPLLVLHTSLALRVVGDLANWPPARTWGAVGNGVAVGLFLVNTVSSIILGVRQAAKSAPRRTAPLV